LGGLLGVQALPQSCQGQSCYIAYTSGATKSIYKLPAGMAKAEGQNDKGEACAKSNLKKLGVTLPTATSARVFSLDLLQNPNLGIYINESLAELPGNEVIDLEKRDGCKPETLLWARGTYEKGEFGGIGKLGPTIHDAFSSAGWGTIGIKDTDGYDAASDNNYCVGLPGGVACVPWLNSMVAKCPNTKFVLGGYSQGAMVARICMAFANDAAKKAVRGLLLYGDPMNGADNKGISSDRIKTFCDPGDGVCQGKFKISGAHLSYDSKTPDGLKWAKEIIKT